MKKLCVTGHLPHRLITWRARKLEEHIAVGRTRWNVFEGDLKLIEYVSGAHANYEVMWHTTSGPEPPPRWFTMIDQIQFTLHWWEIERKKTKLIETLRQISCHINMRMGVIGRERYLRWNVPVPSGRVDTVLWRGFTQLFHFCDAAWQSLHYVVGIAAACCWLKSQHICIWPAHQRQWQQNLSFVRHFCCCKRE